MKKVLLFPFLISRFLFTSEPNKEVKNKIYSEYILQWEGQGCLTVSRNFVKSSALLSGMAELSLPDTLESGDGNIFHMRTHYTSKDSLGFLKEFLNPFFFKKSKKIYKDPFTGRRERFVLSSDFLEEQTVKSLVESVVAFDFLGFNFEKLHHFGLNNPEIEIAVKSKIIKTLATWFLKNYLTKEHLSCIDSCKEVKESVLNYNFGVDFGCETILCSRWGTLLPPPSLVNRLLFSGKTIIGCIEMRIGKRFHQLKGLSLLDFMEMYQYGRTRKERLEKEQLQKKVKELKERERAWKKYF